MRTSCNSIKKVTKETEAMRPSPWWLWMGRCHDLEMMACEKRVMSVCEPETRKDFSPRWAIDSKIINSNPNVCTTSSILSVYFKYHTVSDHVYSSLHGRSLFVQRHEAAMKPVSHLSQDLLLRFACAFIWRGIRIIGLSLQHSRASRTEQFFNFCQGGSRGVRSGISAGPMLRGPSLNIKYQYFPWIFLLCHKFVLSKLELEELPGVIGWPVKRDGEQTYGCAGGLGGLGTLDITIPLWKSRKPERH